MALIRDLNLDLILNDVASAVRLDICHTSEPGTYSEATSANSCGNKSGLVIPSAIDGAVDGRRIVIPAISDGIVTATEDAGFWALTDGVGILYATGTMAVAVPVTSGRFFKTSDITITANDANDEVVATVELVDTPLLVHVVPYLNNTVVQDGAEIKITFFDSLQGFYLFFSDATILSRNILAGEIVTVSGYIRKSAGAAVDLNLNSLNGVPTETISVDSTSLIPFEFATAVQDSEGVTPYINLSGWGGGSVWISDISVKIQVVTPVYVYPTFTKQGEIVASEFTRDAWDDRIYGPVVIENPAGFFRKFYTGYDVDGLNQQICMATSTDLATKTWTKPNLGLFTHEDTGNSNNNIIIHTASPKLNMSDCILVGSTYWLVLRSADTFNSLAYSSPDGEVFTYQATCINQTAHGQHVEPKGILYDAVSGKFRLYYTQGHFEATPARSIGYYEGDALDGAMVDMGLIVDFTSTDPAVQYYDILTWEYDGHTWAAVPLYGTASQILGPLKLYRNDNKGAGTIGGSWIPSGTLIELGADGEWDDSLVSVGRPIFVNGTWWLHYSGSTGLHDSWPNRNNDLGLATELVELPVTTPAVLLEGDLIVKSQSLFADNTGSSAPANDMPVFASSQLALADGDSFPVVIDNTSDNKYLSYVDGKTRKVETIANRNDRANSSRELLADTDFVDTSEWTLGAGWSNTGNQIEQAPPGTGGNNATRPFSYTSGQVINLQYEVSSLVGSIKSLFNNGNGAIFSANGTAEETFTIITNGLITRGYRTFNASVVIESETAREVLPTSGSYTFKGRSTGTEHDLTGRIISGIFTHTVPLSDANRAYLTENPEAIARIFFDGDVIAEAGLLQADIEHYYPCNEGETANNDRLYDVTDQTFATYSTIAGTAAELQKIRSQLSHTDFGFPNTSALRDVATGAMTGMKPAGTAFVGATDGRHLGLPNGIYPIAKDIDKIEGVSISSLIATNVDTTTADLSFTEGTPANTADVFITYGQSRADLLNPIANLTAGESGLQTSVFSLNGGTAFTGLNPSSDPNGLHGLIEVMSSAGLNNDIYTIRVAKGATQIQHFYDGGIYYGELETEWAKALTAFAALGKTHLRIFVIWMHGEADSQSPQRDAYPANRDILVTDLKTLLGNNITIINTHVNDPTGVSSISSFMNSIFDNAALNNADVLTVDTKGVSTQPDGIHTDTAGERTTAALIAAIMNQ